MDVREIAARNGISMHRPPMSPLPPLGKVGAPYWDDKPLAIVGTGPSLKGLDFACFDNPSFHVLAVKEAVWDLPHALAVFGLDRPWMTAQADKLAATSVPKILAVEEEIRPCPVIPGALFLQRARFEGFSDDPGIIQSGANSGFGATNLAYLKRTPGNTKPWRWSLFGFDYRAGPHYCQDRYMSWSHPGRTPMPAADPAQNARYWEPWGNNWTQAMPQIKTAGIEIMNASINSTVKAFRKCEFEEGLRWLINGASS